MNSCELASLVNAVSCAIAKCVPKDELPLISAIFGQISCTLTTISVQENLINPATPPSTEAPAPEAGIIAAPAPTPAPTPAPAPAPAPTPSPAPAPASTPPGPASP